MAITKFKLYRDNKLFKNSKIDSFQPESLGLSIDFNNTKDPNKGFWVDILKGENKPVFNGSKKEVEFIWEGKWETDFKKDKDTTCKCKKTEKFHFRLVFEKKTDYEKIEEFFEKGVQKIDVKRKKSKTRRKHGGRKNNKMTKKKSRGTNDKFKKELKKCEKKCKHDDKFKKELKEELKRLDNDDMYKKDVKKLKYMKKTMSDSKTYKCSTKCLNDQGIYYHLQEVGLLKKYGGNKQKEDCEKVEKFFKEPVKKGNRMKWSPPIWGIPEDEGRVRKHKKYNVFEEKSVKLPKGYKKAVRTPFLKEHIEDNICGERIPAVKTEVSEFKKGHKHTLIHDNGGRPFVMYFSPQKDSVAIYKIPKGFLEPEGVYHKDKTFVKYYSELVKRYKCKDVFIGLSPKNEMTKFSKGFGKKFEGNTNLIKLSDKRYVYVGETIYEFTSLHDIVDYQSPVGNNDVPYPYAIDEKNNYYLMLDHVIVNFPDKVENPYDKYWNGGLMTTDSSFTPPKEPVYPNFQDIEEFYILEKGKKEIYTLRHDPNPAKEYDRLTKSGSLSLAYTDGKEKDLSKKDYIQLMNDFGKLLNYKPLKIKLVHKRVGW